MDRDYAIKLFGIVVISSVMLSFSLVVATFSKEDQVEKWLQHTEQIKEINRSIK